MPSRRQLFIAAALLAASPALAQTAPPMRVRGTIASFEGNVLTVTTREGQPMRIALADNVTVSAPRMLTLADIKKDTFIGTAATPGPDGKLVAQEVVVFPESLRGSGEGHYPWDLNPGSTMTNANVTAAVEAKDGRVLNLSYKGGTVEVTVPANAPIVTFGPAEKSDLKPGAHVFLAAIRQSDGSYTAARVTVEKNGVAPPM